MKRKETTKKSAALGKNERNQYELLDFALLYFFNLCFYFILLYNTVLVLTYIDMNPPRVYMRSQT